VTISAGGRIQTNRASTAVGYASSSEPEVHFGLGKATRADWIEIQWPSGAQQRLEAVSAGKLHVIREP
jgi:hypothetical protein